MLTFETYPIAKQYSVEVLRESRNLVNKVETLLKNEQFFVNVDPFILVLLNKKDTLDLHLDCLLLAIKNYETNSIT